MSTVAVEVGYSGSLIRDMKDLCLYAFDVVSGVGNICHKLSVCGEGNKKERGIVLSSLFFFYHKVVKYRNILVFFFSSTERYILSELIHG